MDDGFNQWLQGSSAAPHLQRMGINQSMFAQPQQDPYSNYQSELMGWINANPGEEGLQKTLLGEYFSGKDPRYQEEQYNQKRVDDMNFALALMELGEKDMAMQILGGYGLGNQPEAQQSFDMSMYGYPGGGPDVTGYQADALRNIYEPRLEGEADPETLQLYNLLAGGDKKATSAYYGAGPSFWDRAGAYFMPYGKEWWNAEASSGTREKAARNAYGL